MKNGHRELINIDQCPSFPSFITLFSEKSERWEAKTLKDKKSELQIIAVLTVQKLQIGKRISKRIRNSISFIPSIYTSATTRYDKSLVSQPPLKRTSTNIYLALTKVGFFFFSSHKWLSIHKMNPNIPN